MTPSPHRGEIESAIPTRYVGTKELRYTFSPSMTLEMRLKAFMKPEHYFTQHPLLLYSDASATVRLLPFGGIEFQYAQQVEDTKKYVKDKKSDQIILTREIPVPEPREHEFLIHLKIMPTPDVRRRLGSLSIMNIEQHSS
ncbi:MAG: hypothetical protein ABJA64_02120, partial [Candidatus Saccharibacteria bacterium]